MTPEEANELARRMADFESQIAAKMIEAALFDDADTIEKVVGRLMSASIRIALNAVEAFAPDADMAMRHAAVATVTGKAMMAAIVAEKACAAAGVPLSKRAH